MADPAIQNSKDAPELRLAIRNKRPVAADDMGGLLIALAADYRRMNRGRTLIVVGIETGSFIIRLQEAVAATGAVIQTGVAVGKAASGLKKFIETIRSLIVTAKSRPTESELFRRKSRAGIKSAEKLLEIAERAEGEIEFYRKAGDEEIRIKFTSTDALRIRTEADAARLALPSQQKDSLRLPHHIARDVDDFAGRLIAAGGDAETAISALATALSEAGFSFVLELVASKLEGDGHLSLAQAVRTAARSNRRNEPRLLT